MVYLPGPERLLALVPQCALPFYPKGLGQAQGSPSPGYGGLSITFSTCLLPFSMFCGGKNPRVKYEKMW